MWLRIRCVRNSSSVFKIGHFEARFIPFKPEGMFDL